MKSDKFSIEPARERLIYTEGTESGMRKKRSVPAYRRAERWDYFLNPDRFFARILKGDAPVLVPLLMMLLSIVIPIMVLRILLEFLNPFIPYSNLPGSGLDFSLVVPIIVIWIMGILYFLIFSGQPSGRSEKTRSWGERGIRIFAVMGFAIIPVIVSGLLGTASLLMILPGIAIVPPPTVANDAYQHANADYQRSVDQTFASMDIGKAPDEHLAEQRMKYRQVMTQSQAYAEQEATDGLKKVTSQLLQDPALSMLGSAMQVLSLITLLWVGILLAYGIRHALDISLSWAAILAGFLVCVQLFLQLAH